MCRSASPKLPAFDETAAESPAEEHEVFGLVRMQGLTKAEVLGISATRPPRNRQVRIVTFPGNGYDSHLTSTSLSRRAQADECLTAFMPV
jgi:hypothetical protein